MRHARVGLVGWGAGFYWLGLRGLVAVFFFILVSVFVWVRGFEGLVGVGCRGGVLWSVPAWRAVFRGSGVRPLPLQFVVHDWVWQPLCSGSRQHHSGSPEL